MESVLRQLILDFHERALPSLWPRQFSPPFLKGKATVLVGMRRTGKTWLLYQIMQNLITQKKTKQNLLYLNFEDERLLPFKTTDLQKILDVFYRIYPTLKDQTCYFFFDEIQNVAGWEQFIRRLLDNENCQVLITGSSAKLLSKEIATSLRGRSLSYEVFPFSFSERLLQLGLSAQENQMGSKQKAKIEHAFTTYLDIGGFPEIQTIAEEQLRYRILQDYVNVVLFRDIVERHRMGETLSLRYLIRHLLHAPGALFSVNKFYQDLKSQGIACSKNSLHTQLAYLEDSFLIYPVPLLSFSERAQRVNPRKIYAIDVGLLQAWNALKKTQSGAVLENFVFMELRRKGWPICYYRTKQGFEVDFIVQTKMGLRLLQVSQQLESPETRVRELRALSEAMLALNLKESTLITLFEENSVKTHAGTIHILPAWKWGCTPDDFQLNR